MEECESGKSAKWMRNFGISIGSKGERRVGRGTFVVGGEEGRSWVLFVEIQMRFDTLPFLGCFSSAPLQS